MYTRVCLCLCVDMCACVEVYVCVCVSCFAVPEGRVKLFTLNPVSRVLHTKSNQSAKEDRHDDFKFQVCFEGS